MNNFKMSPINTVVNRNFFTTLFVFLSILFSCLTHSLFSQNILFSSQEELDAFDPDITEITGNLGIQYYENYGSPITDLSPLTNLNSIGGDLIIQHCGTLENIDGLENINQIEGQLIIQNNNALSNLDGLSGLTSINDNLIIANMPNLKNIDGLTNLQSIQGNLNIEMNQDLMNLNGLSNLSSVNGNIQMRNNFSILNLDGLSKITSVNGELKILSNSELTNLNGLGNLSSVGGDLVIGSNINLLNLDGLSNLTSVGGSLGISSNPAITDLDGLSNINSIEGGYINLFDNYSLYDCCSMKKFINPDAFAFYILNNSYGCNSIDEMLASPFCGPYSQLYFDYNQDCIYDETENVPTFALLGLIKPLDRVISSNSHGYWKLDSLPLGDYTFEYETPGQWSSTCPEIIPFSFSGEDDSLLMFQLGIYSTEPCVFPEVSIHMPFIRPCFERQKIYIQACNLSNATGALTDPYVIVELDTAIYLEAATYPFTDLGNNQYRFDLGDMNPGICHEIVIDATVSCNLDLTGTSLCMSAELFPVESCSLDDTPDPFPPTSTPCTTEWDKSSLNVEGYCQGDTIIFEITNTGEPGEGDMTCLHPVTIYIDGEIFQTDSIQLQGGSTFTYSFPANGESLHLTVPQHPLHPGNSHPNATVENCGGETVLSRMNEFPLDDEDGFLDIYCGAVTNSYDPNDKRGFPLGVGEENHILPNQRIQYMVRFQNTGTDTAFTVVVRDTLEDELDILSVQVGVSSHAYEFEMYGPRVLQWTFNDIMLPDSTTNEPESNGFLTFTVEQIADLPDGTEINNSAAIYFDFNPPIITDLSNHMVQRPYPVQTETIELTTCDISIDYNGTTYYHDGIYYEMSEDGWTQLYLVVNVGDGLDVDNTLSQNGNSLTSNQSNATYQWLDCDNGNNQIIGEDGQTFTPTVSGNYAVEITLEGCTEISECEFIMIVGTDEIEDNNLRIFPNPTRGHLQIELDGIREVDMEIMDVAGRTLGYEKINASSSEMDFNYPQGLYFIRMTFEDGSTVVRKIIRK